MTKLTYKGKKLQSSGEGFLIYIPPILTLSFEIYFTGTTMYNLRAGNSISTDDNPIWEMGDGNTLTTINSDFSYTYESPYLEPVEKTIKFTVNKSNDGFDALYIFGNNNTSMANKIYGIDLSKINSLSDIRIYSTKIINLDLSSITKLSGNILLFSNDTLTDITFPLEIDSDANNISSFRLHTNPNVTDYDFSMFTKLGGYIGIYSNTNLTNLKFPTTIDSGANNITTFHIRSNPNVTDYDFSMFTKLGGYIQINENYELTKLTFPSVIDSGANNISYFQMSRNHKITHYDLSMFTKLGGDIQIMTHLALTGITFPSEIDSGANVITRFRLYNNYNVTDYDISMFTKLGENIQIYSNNTLTDITFPPVIDSGANNILYFHLHLNPNVTNYDISMFTKLGGSIWIHSNTSLTGITFPSEIDSGAGNIIHFYAHSNSNITEYDFSSLTNLRRSSSTSTSNRFDCSNCGNLTTIYFPQVLTGSSLVCLSNFIYLNNCALNETTVDALFAELLRYYSIITPPGNVTVLIDGGTNSPPSTQGLSDIDDLETIFTNAGKTISITKNDI
jgi:hypothetical protein